VRERQSAACAAPLDKTGNASAGCTLLNLNHTLNPNLLRLPVSEAGDCSDGIEITSRITMGVLEGFIARSPSRRCTIHPPDSRLEEIVLFAIDHEPVLVR